jgi:hypothetical protein
MFFEGESMKVLRSIRSIMVGAACIGMLLPVQTLSAAGSDKGLPTSPSVVADVSLTAAGGLRGGLRNAEGQPLPNSEIRFVHGTTGRDFRTASDQDGRFVFDELPSGLYRVEASGSSFACRCWAPNTAPPVASKELLVIADGRVTRGQKPIMEALWSTPAILCLMIVAAIAIPIAVHNSNRNAS